MRAQHGKEFFLQIVFIDANQDAIALVVHLPRMAHKAILRFAMTAAQHRMAAMGAKNFAQKDVFRLGIIIMVLRRYWRICSQLLHFYE